ncbi:hypothetical protein BJ742DRAFT_805357 [Cladochytrium replicatum]|nr:hypothetical protein BJ742DRAFT_805357 [Cladochytrium replicatum]
MRKPLLCFWFNRQFWLALARSQNFFSKVSNFSPISLRAFFEFENSVCNLTRRGPTGASLTTTINCCNFLTSG